MYIIHSGLDDSSATWLSVSLPNGFCSATIKYLMMYPRYRRPMERSLVGMEVSDEESDLGYEVGSLVGFFLEILVQGGPCGRGLAWSFTGPLRLSGWRILFLVVRVLWLN